MTKRQIRSPQEILEARRAQLEAAEKRAAIAVAKDSPYLSSLVDAKAETNKLVTQYGKALNDNNPQSFANRRKTHELWLDLIDAQEAYDREAHNLAVSNREAIDSAIRDLAERIPDDDADESEVESFENEVQDVLDNLPDMMVELRELQTALDEAKTAQEVFKALRTAPKRASATAE